MSNKPIRKRKVLTKVGSKDVDYGVLKSLIRDEVSLQVNRKLRDVIKPLYQAMMSDHRYTFSALSLPEWARELLDETIEESWDQDLINSDDEDYWR